jgi:multidrug efflux pump
MSLSATFIERPVATTLLTIAIAIAGAIAFIVLPVSPLPQVDFPTIAVGASLPGASAEIMASSIATPLERQFGHIAGVSEMTSASSLGTTSITLQFDLNRDIDGAARDVEAAINAARTYLPANLPANPTYRKVNPADAPIMILALTSNVYDPGKLYDVASTVIEQKLSQISGVGQVSVGGGALPSVRVDVIPTQLNAYGLTIPQVQSALGLQNSDRPRGQVSNGFVTADIITNGQISKADDYKDLIIGYNKGAAVRLADVADVTDSVQNIRAAGYLNGVRSIPIIISREHHPDGESDSRSDSLYQGDDSAGHRFGDCAGSDDDDSRVGERRGAVADFVGDLGHFGGVFVFAELARDADSERGRAGVVDRDVRDHVPVRIQPRQFVADGADDFDGLRRR